MRGKGSLRHRQLQAMLAESCRRAGHIAVIEAFVQGKSIDLLVETFTIPRKVIAVEVQIHRDWALLDLQLRRNWEVGIRMQIAVVQDGRVEHARAYLGRSLPPGVFEGVRVYSTSDIFRINFAVLWV